MGNKKRELTLEEKYIVEQEQQRQKRALQGYLKGTGHGMPTNRRDFLASGVLGVAGFLMAPSILELVLREEAALAQSAQCVSTGTGMIPYINVNFAGGAGMAGNYIPLTPAGDLLASYSRIGAGLPANFSAVREFNNAPFLGATDGTLLSQMLQGIRNKTTQAVRDKTAFVGVCVRSQDDSADNRANIAGLVQAAGLKGSDLPNLGRTASPTGVNQRFALKAPSAPLAVGNFNDILGALKAEGAFATLSDPQKASLVTMIRDLSTTQKRNLASSSSGKTLGNLVECATGKNVDLNASTGAGIDPRLDTAMQGIWGIAANTGTNQASVFNAGIVYNALNGKAGAAGLQIGGFDYHGQGRGNQDNKDREGGEMIGNILASAAALNKPVFIHVTSDGAVDTQSSNNPAADWVGDNGSSGMSWIIAYHPDGRPATNGFQIGGFNAGQAAVDDTIMGWNPEKAATAIFANYMAFNKKLSAFQGLSNGQIATTDVDKILRFVG